ncbi:MAG: MMPL family transporter [Gaiellaceae bacterium]
MRLSTESLARACALHPWRTMAAWIALVVLSIGVVAALLGDTLTTEGEVTSQTDSKRAEELVLEHFPPSAESLEQETTEAVVVSFQSGTVDRERIQALAEELRQLGATNVVTSADEGQEWLDSEDGNATALLVGLGRNEDSLPDLVEAAERLDDDPAVEAAMTGELTIDEDFGTLSEEDLQEGELFFGAPAALIVLLLVFGTVIAGVIPLVLALLSIAVALALTAIVGQAFELSVFVTNMIFGMGLALGIDYSLFILSRFREERSQGREKLDAIVTSGATASRAVLFSGAAFVLAMTGLELVPNTIMRSLATGAILVGIVSVVAALTLLPAVISLLGDRVESLRIPYFGRAASAGAESRFWGRIVRAVLRRPVVSLVAAVGLLLAAAVPVLALESGTAGISTLPDRFESKQGFLLLNREFPGQTTDPVSIVVEGDSASPQVRAAVEDLQAELEQRRIFGEASTETSPDGGLVVLTVPVAGDAVSAAAVETVRDLREDVIPATFADSGAEAFVGGATAEDIDYYDVMDTWLPIVFVFVLGLSFILLTIAFRSIVVPATAIAMNLLSVGAAYGLLVLVFVEGVGNELFGFQQVDIVEAWVPLFLFAVLFGLSMDYQVFLLSRIRERYSQTGSNEDAVSFGVGSTARLITGAALIIIAVFAGFARGDLVMFQQMGFGVAVALLIDATIIRPVVVPATMTLLGRWNWYLPSWLSWLPDVHVEGHEEEPSPRRAT